MHGLLCGTQCTYHYVIIMILIMSYTQTQNMLTFLSVCKLLLVNNTFVYNTFVYNTTCVNCLDHNTHAPTKKRESEQICFSSTVI